jgi:hypothetical protein
MMPWGRVPDRGVPILHQSTRLIDAVLFRKHDYFDGRHASLLILSVNGDASNVTRTVSSNHGRKKAFSQATHKICGVLDCHKR